MKSNVPWSVKGIDPEARVVAKEAARKAGMTLGEWMTHMIRETGSEDENTTNSDTDTPPTTGVSSDQLRAVVDSLNRLNERLKTTEENIKRSEEKSRQAVGGLNQGLETVFERLKRVEKEKAAGVSGEIIDRVEKLETSGADRERIESLKALESALSQMVHQFDSTQKHALSRVEENEKAVELLQSKVNTLDTRITAGFQEVHDALDTVGQQLDQTERTAKAIMLEAKEAANSTDEEFVERTSKKLQLLGNEIKRSGDQIAAVETMVASLTSKIDDAERRSAEGIAEVENELTSLREEIVPALEKTADIPAASKAAAEAEESVAALQRSYEKMLARLDGGADPAAAADVVGETVPLPEDDQSVDEEFDEVFAQDPQSDDEHDADGDVTETDPSKLSAREKIIAAAKARKERLAKESAENDEPSSHAAETSDDEDDDAVPKFSLDDALTEPPDEEEDDGQNRKIGLRLIILLGLLLLGMIAAAAILFGFGGGKDDAASLDDAAPIEQSAVEDAYEPADTLHYDAADNQLAPALPTATDGSALYEEGKTLLANAVSLEDRVQAFTIIREAALYGHVPAQYRLGEMYFTGVGAEKDLSNAKRWFTEAALSGNAAAMHRLGTLAIDPQIDGQNFIQAIDWFEKAANYGVVDSMYNLGYLFDPSSADLLPSNMLNAEQSYYWYALAARQGDIQAQTDGANVANTLTAEKRNDVETRVATWEPVQYDASVNDGLQILN